MLDFSVFPFGNQVPSKTESIAEPFDHCGWIAIYDSRHHRHNVVGRAAKYFPLYTDLCWYLIH